MLSHLARQLMDAQMRRLDTGNHRFQRAPLDVRVAAQCSEHGLLTVEFLQQIGLEVGACRHLGQLEQRQERGMMGVPQRRRRIDVETLEQVFQPQQGADALGERVFVIDHATVAGSYRPIVAVYGRNSNRARRIQVENPASPACASAR